MKLRNSIWGLAFCVLLQGCVTALPTYGPDGRQAHAIDCSGAGLTWNACLQKAGAICMSRGYDVIERNGERVTTKAVAAAGEKDERTTIAASGDTQRAMMVACR